MRVTRARSSASKYRFFYVPWNFVCLRRSWKTLFFDVLIIFSRPILPFCLPLFVSNFFLEFEISFWFSIFFSQSFETKMVSNEKAAGSQIAANPTDLYSIFDIFVYFGLNFWQFYSGWTFCVIRSEKVVIWVAKNREEDYECIVWKRQEEQILIIDEERLIMEEQHNISLWNFEY